MAKIFRDVGLESEDFYSIFYTLSLFTAIQMKYGGEVLNIKGSTDLIRKYLISKGIAIDINISDADLTYIYENWIDEFKARGTKRVYREKNSIKGLGISGNNIEFIPNLPFRSQELDMSFSFKEGSYTGFRTLIETIAGSQINLQIETSGALTFDIFGAGNLTINPDYAGELKRVRVFMQNLNDANTTWNIYLFVNGNVINQEPLQLPYSTFDHDTTNRRIVYLMKEDCGTIANFSMKTKRLTDEDYLEYLFDIYNEGRLFDELLNKEYILGYEVGNTASVIQDEDFNNTMDYSPIYGEMKRLLYYNNTDEFISALSGIGDLGWLTGQSSPTSNDTINYVNMNKVKDTNLISTYPFIFGSTASDLQISDITNLGDSEINVNSNGFDWQFGDITSTDSQITNSNLDGLIKVDESLDYQLSIYVRNVRDVLEGGQEQDVSFGVSCYDVFGSKIDTTHLNAGTANLFVDTFRINQFNDLWLNLRGVLYNSGYIGTDTREILNISGSGMLKMPENTVYIRPFLKVVDSSSDTNLKNFKFKNLFVSLLKNPIYSGIINPVKTVINVIKDNSGSTEDETNKQIDKYFNYKTVVKNKYI